MAIKNKRLVGNGLYELTDTGTGQTAQSAQIQPMDPTGAAGINRSQNGINRAQNTGNNANGSLADLLPNGIAMTPMATPVTIWDAQGNQGKGYNINGTTYLDMLGTERLPDWYKAQIENGDVYLKTPYGSMLYATPNQTDANGNWQAAGNPWYQQAQDIWAKIQNREPFEFDLANNPAYQAMREQYAHLGQRAMEDTMGQAAGLTGGYGSSYAQGVGQQAYGEYLQKLNDAVPDLYAQEWQRYNQEGENLYQGLNSAMNLYQNAYNEFANERDYTNEQAWREKEWEFKLSEAEFDRLMAQKSQALSEWAQTGTASKEVANILGIEEGAKTSSQALAELQQQIDAEREAYDRQQNEMKWNYNVAQDEKQWDYNVQQDTLNREQNAKDEAYDRAIKQLSIGFMPSDQELAAAGITKAEAIYRQNLALNGGVATSGGGGGSGGSGRSSSSSSKSYNSNNGGYDYDAEPTYEEQRKQTMTNAYSQLSNYGKNVVTWYETGDYRGPLQGETLRQYLERMYAGQSESVSNHDLPLIRQYYKLQ